jgi:hypothetical protein
MQPLLVSSPMALLPMAMATSMVNPVQEPSLPQCQFGTDGYVAWSASFGLGTVHVHDASATPHTTFCFNPPA